MEEIGGMIVHAEAAQAALDKGLAAHAENVANITRLIQYGGGVLKKLQAEAEQLGPRAEQAGAGAVREEVRESLAGAGAVVGDAARAALRPVMADVVAGIGEANRGAQTSPSPAASVFARQIGGSAGLIDKNEFQRIEVCLPGEPVPALPQNVRALLLLGVRGLFLTVIS